VTVNWSLWRPRLLYGAFFVAAFLLALRQTLPVEAAKERLILEAGQRGFEVDAAEVGPAGLVGVGLKDVTLKDKTGLTVALDRLDASVPLWPLVTGKRRVALSARLYDGSVRGTFDLAGSPQVMELQIDRVDLSQAVALRKASGVDFSGLVSGGGHVSVPADEKGRAEGRMDLSVKAAGVNGGSLPMGNMGGLTLPKVALGDLTAVLKVENGKGTFEKLGTAGGDVDLAADGLYFVVQPRLEYAPLFGKVAVRLSEAFAQKPENKVFKNLLDAALGQAKGPGGYQLQVFGSLGHPQVRPAAGVTTAPSP
jgi:type II secretion system protein N